MSEGFPRFDQRRLRQFGSAAELAKRTGLNRRSFFRPLSFWTADFVACRLGRHPATIWPDWWEKSEQYGLAAGRKAAK